MRRLLLLLLAASAASASRRRWRPPPPPPFRYTKENALWVGLKGLFIGSACVCVCVCVCRFVISSHLHIIHACLCRIVS